MCVTAESAGDLSALEVDGLDDHPGTRLLEINRDAFVAGFVLAISEVVHPEYVPRISLYTPAIKIMGKIFGFDFLNKLVFLDLPFLRGVLSLVESGGVGQPEKEK